MPAASRYASVFRPGPFEGRAAIVTGGGSGLGRCNAHELASLGARVALVGRKIEKLNGVKNEIAQAGGQFAAPLEKISAKGWDAVVRTNLTGGGAIVNIIADMWQGMPTMGRSGAICYLLSPAAAFISGSCMRVDGAVPNAKRPREISNKNPTPAYDGFHLASKPKVLD